MIVVRLSGGLGNQMFQYAAGRALSLRLNTSLKLDPSFLEDRSFRENFTFRDFELSCFRLEENFIDSAHLKRFYHVANALRSLKITAINRVLFNYRVPLPKVFDYSGTLFNPEFCLLSDNTLIDGYWQSEEYFKEFADDIRKDFTFKDVIPPADNELIDHVKACNSISVHIRRGDYASNAVIGSIHGLLDQDYYLDSIKYMSERVSDPVFVFFSDDMSWVKEHFGHLHNQYDILFTESQNSRKGCDDMRVMSNCAHNIIANSSFSWWGAWLNQNPDKIVVAPRNWFNDVTISTGDMILSGWARL